MRDDFPKEYAALVDMVDALSLEMIAVMLAEIATAKSAVIGEDLTYAPGERERFQEDYQVAAVILDRAADALGEIDT